MRLHRIQITVLQRTPKSPTGFELGNFNRDKRKKISLKSILKEIFFTGTQKAFQDVMRFFEECGNLISRAEQLKELEAMGRIQIDKQLFGRQEL